MEEGNTQHRPHVGPALYNNAVVDIPSEVHPREREIVQVSANGGTISH